MYFIVTFAGSKVIGPFTCEKAALEYKRQYPKFAGVVRDVQKP